MTTSSEFKKRKLDETNEWFPPSVTEIEKPFKFDSTTYLSEIPKEILENPTKTVVLGVDEAGRGPVLGPMVYGVAYALEDSSKDLQEKYGFADSKTLKDAKRQELFKGILKDSEFLSANIGWAARTMTAKDISAGMLQSVQGKGSYNLNEQAHDTTIQLIKDIIAKDVNVKKIYVDTVGSPASYQSKLKKIFPNIEITVAKKADSIYPIVSVASVVAKVTRDQNLAFFNNSFKSVSGQSIGSGYPSDPNTNLWLNSNVDKVFGWGFGLTRFSWQTAKDSLEKNGAVNVIYEDQLVKDKTDYGDVTDFFSKRDKQKSSGAIDIRHYGSSDLIL